jgi:hypothetical protein
VRARANRAPTQRQRPVAQQLPADTTALQALSNPAEALHPSRPRMQPRAACPAATPLPRRNRRARHPRRAAGGGRPLLRAHEQPGHDHRQLGLSPPIQSSLAPPPFPRRAAADRPRCFGQRWGRVLTRRAKVGLTRFDLMRSRLVGPRCCLQPLTSAVFLPCRAASDAPHAPPPAAPAAVAPNPACALWFN